ncbi:MAG: hypothetical protein ACLS43_10225 [Evtepia gabavorous]
MAAGRTTLWPPPCPAPMEIWARVSQSGPCPVTVGEGQIWLAEYARSHPGDLPPVSPVPGRDAAAGGEPPGSAMTETGLMWSKFLPVGGTGNCWPFWEEVERENHGAALLAGLRAPRGEAAEAGRVAMLPQNLRPLLEENPQEDLLDRQREMDLPPAEGAAVAEIAAHAAWRGCWTVIPTICLGESSSRPPWQRSC